MPWLILTCSDAHNMQRSKAVFALMNYEENKYDRE